MKTSSIVSESDIQLYLDYFKKLNDLQIQDEITLWENKIQDDDYTHYEFLAFLKILDLLEVKSNNDIQTIDVLSSTIEELKDLSDYTLDQYEGSEKQTKLLDNINKSLTECEMLYKYYNEKIIN
jgi:FtsZ-binding cell division protein ZapB